ncbi:hypothetical protein SAMN04489760_107139 [Syntrophus gentianae]|uniref:Uncharacterized protein n=1 Tax=Syntrophus gentianae TaxID=43775 RepID=A0A1H7WT88_9BACT|nr:hypothetical protein SAMN04489760_107139 [Syntrophus gentianae]
MKKYHRICRLVKEFAGTTMADFTKGTATQIEMCSLIKDVPQRICSCIF